MKTAVWDSDPMPVAVRTAKTTMTSKEFCHALY